MRRGEEGKWIWSVEERKREGRRRGEKRIRELVRKGRRRKDGE